MSNETIVTIVGNLTDDPALKFTPSGAAVADFTVASTSRVFKDGAWSDGSTLFLRCSIWREAAEAVAESCRRGQRVIVQGRLTQRSFETREGEKRTVVELQAQDVGVVVRPKHVGGEPFQRSTRPAADPWATSDGEQF